MCHCFLYQLVFIYYLVISSYDASDIQLYRSVQREQVGLALGCLIRTGVYRIGYKRRATRMQYRVHSSTKQLSHGKAILGLVASQLVSRGQNLQFAQRRYRPVQGRSGTVHSKHRYSYYRIRVFFHATKFSRIILDP